MHSCDKVGHSHVKPDDRFAYEARMPVCALLQKTKFLPLKAGPESTAKGVTELGFKDDSHTSKWVQGLDLRPESGYLLRPYRGLLD